METLFPRGILFLSVLLLGLADLTRGLMCDDYDRNQCNDDHPEGCKIQLKKCEGIENPSCFAFWQETSDGQVIVQQKGCWNDEVRCNRSVCTNFYTNTLYFCCCRGHHCNNELRLADGKWRPHVTQVLYHEHDPSNRTLVAPTIVDEPDDIEPADPMTALDPNQDERSSSKLTSTSTAGGSAGGVADPTLRSPVQESMPMSTLTLVLVVIIILICVLLASVGAVVMYRFFRQQMLKGKKTPYDLESTLVMAPLMSKEYENQDGCLLLKNLVLIEQKAMGRYGEVWKGRLGDTIVAVKITPVAEMASWKNEVHIYHRFLMPNPRPGVLRFMLSGHRPAEQRMFLVTEYHPMGSLVDLLKGKPITCEEADRIMTSMLSGLAFLHDSDGKPAIAHRDFKSTNVLIRTDMSACIADFGLATAFEADDRIGDKHGQVGTRRYMAPELLEGAISLTVVSFLRVDVYACGLVLWEIMSRTQLTTTPTEPMGVFKLPLEEELGVSPTNEAIQTAVVTKRLRPTLKPSWKRDMRNIQLCVTIEECWDADPEARPSASCLLNRLRLLSSGVVNECDLPVSSGTRLLGPTVSETSG